MRKTRFGSKEMNSKMLIMVPWLITPSSSLWLKISSGWLICSLKLLEGRKKKIEEIESTKKNRTKSNRKRRKEDWKKRKENWKNSRKKNRKLRKKDCKRSSKSKMRLISLIKLFCRLIKIKLVKVHSSSKLSSVTFW